LHVGTANASGILRVFVATNRQFAIFDRMGEVNDPSEPQARVAHLASLLSLGANSEMKRYLYEWCGPCPRAMPFMVNLYEQYKDRGIEILYISVDSKADQYKVGAFAREQEISYPVLFDGGVKELYGVQSFPTTMFIDRQGKVRYREAGFDPEEAPRLFDAVVNELLGPSARSKEAAERVSSLL
jgi:thiol-disulfide isomerase/thioredoxin